MALSMIAHRAVMVSPSVYHYAFAFL